MLYDVSKQCIKVFVYICGLKLKILFIHSSTIELGNDKLFLHPFSAPLLLNLSGFPRELIRGFPALGGWNTRRGCTF